MMRLLLLLLLACSSTKKVPTETSGDYEFGRASRDGIGKFFEGREIAHVMGHLGASWLERDSRVREERPDLLLEALGLHKDMRVADIGAGTGYHALRMSPRVERVYAVDLQEEMLELLRSRAQEAGAKNVELVRGTEKETGLAPSSVDLALMVDAYHEFSYPLEMLRSIARALRPNGRVVLVEYRGEDPSIPIKPLHKMTERQVIRELKRGGFSHVKTVDTLPSQHILIFELDKP